MLRVDLAMFMATLLLCLSFSVQAEGTEKAGAEWRPPSGEFDWVQLVSGEWLKGEIHAMYKKSLEFDSDKLKLLSIDWDDVQYLESARAMTVSIEGHGVATGVLKISGERVSVTYGPEITKFNRDVLVSFTQAGEHERDLWTIKATISFDVKTGNTDQRDYSAKVGLKRRTAKTRLVVDYIGTISMTRAVTDSLEQTVNNHRITGNFDYYKTRHFFYNPAFFEIFRDPFLNIDRKITLGAGVGYGVIDNDTTELTISGGPSFVRTNFMSVADDKPEGESSAALVIRTDYDTDLTDSIELIAKYNIQYANQASGGYLHHAIVTLENELTGQLDLDVSFVWDRISKPTESTEGTIPSSDDFRIMLGITYEY